MIESDSNYHLYILALKDEPFIKIGITQDVMSRIYQLGGIDRFDPSQSYLVTAKNRHIIKRLEASLKAMFWEHRKESGAPLHSGNTEIFCEKVLPDALGVIGCFRAHWPDSDKVRVHRDISNLLNESGYNRIEHEDSMVTMNIDDQHPDNAHDSTTLDIATKNLPPSIRESILLLAVERRLQKDDPVLALLIKYVEELRGTIISQRQQCERDKEDMARKFRQEAEILAEKVQAEEEILAEKVQAEEEAKAREVELEMQDQARCFKERIESNAEHSRGVEKRLMETSESDAEYGKIRESALEGEIVLLKRQLRDRVVPKWYHLLGVVALPVAIVFIVWAFGIMGLKAGHIKGWNDAVAEVEQHKTITTVYEFPYNVQRR